MYEWAKRVASSKSAKAPEGAPESMNAREFLADVEISLFGCCSYEDTWRPGIEGWGESDAEARKGGYVGVPDWDQLVNMYTKSEERVAQLEKQNEALKAKLFCNCGEPYFGAQIVGTPLRCERCGREVGEN